MRILAALLLTCSLQAADWTLLRVPGIDLYTNSSDRSAHQTLDRLQQIRSLLGSPAKPEPVPLRVILFATRNEYLQFARDATVAGFYQSGVERDYIVISAGAALDRVIAHEYVHFVTTDRGVIRQAWLEEGLADFYSTFDGKQIGVPVPAYLQILQSRNWLSAKEMNSPRQVNDLYYAQAWALVHMLRREPRFPEFITEDMIAELRQYVRSMRATPVKFPNTASPPVTEPVSALNAQLLLADLALRTNHNELARTLYSQAARDFPNSSAAATGLAALAYGDGDRDKASTELDRALSLNDRDALAWFQRGIVDNDTQALRRAVELNPGFAEAHVLLGVRATDDGDLDIAIQHLEKAVSLMPRKSYAWYSLAFAQQKLGDEAGAALSAENALRTAATPEQTAMARTLLESLR